MRSRSRYVRMWMVGCLCVTLGHMGCQSEVEKARLFVKTQQYDSAVKIYEKILKEDSKNIAVLEEVATLFCEGASYSSFRCLEFAKRLQEKKKDHPKLKKWLGRSLYENAFERTTSMELSKAQEYLDQYLAIEPQDGRAHYIGAMIKYRLGKKNTDEDDLRASIQNLDKAVQFSTPTSTIQLDPKDKKESPLQWEALKLKGEILESLLIKEKVKFEKAQKKGEKFVPKEADFKAGIEAYEKTHQLNHTQPNATHRFFPYFQIAMFYTNFKEDQEKALEWLLKAEKMFPKSREVINGVYMVYSKMKEQTNPKNKKKRQEYEEKANEYKEKYANLPK